MQEEHKQFILVQVRSVLRPVRGEESCIISHRGACSRGYKQSERERIPGPEVECCELECVQVQVNLSARIVMCCRVG